jgi:ubiquinone/menaquinone biosynthesis C-methylase UbiE
MKVEYLILRLRNIAGVPFSPQKELSKLNLAKGQTVLDFGCGIGSFTLPLAQRVGPEGKAFALDREASALAAVEKAARRRGLANIETILSDGPTGLPDRSVDLVLFIGVLPSLEDAAPILAELSRVLKPDGTLVTRHCFRISREEVLSEIVGSKQFELKTENGNMLSFSPL